MPTWSIRSILNEGESEGRARMAKREAGVENNRQLALELPPKPERHSATVVRMLDAETRSIRRDAIERVRNGGIFEPPKTLLK